MRNFVYIILITMFFAACGGGEKKAPKLEYSEINPMTWDTSKVVSPENLVKEVKKWYEAIDQVEVSVLIDPETKVVLGDDKEQMAASNRVYTKGKVVAAVLADTAELMKFRELVQTQSGDVFGFDQKVVIKGVPFKFRQGLALDQARIMVADSAVQMCGKDKFDAYNYDKTKVYKAEKVLTVFDAWNETMVKVQGTCSMAMGGNRTTFEDRSEKREDRNYPKILEVGFANSFKGDGTFKVRTVKGIPYYANDRRSNEMKVGLKKAVWITK